APRPSAPDPAAQRLSGGAIFGRPALADASARGQSARGADAPDRWTALDLHGTAADRRDLPTARRGRPMTARASLLLVLALAGAFAASTLLPFDSLRTLFEDDRPLALSLLVELRLPRALLALAYGAMLGAAGAAVQA